MKNIFLLSYLLLFTASISLGQNSTIANEDTTKTIYYDLNWSICNESIAEYYRIITFNDKGDPKGKVKDFYISGKIQMEGYYSSYDHIKNEGVNKVGLFVYYYENGNKSQQETYTNDKLEGIYTAFYESGNKSAERNYNNGKLEGIYTTFYESGNKSFEGNYNNGKLEGMVTAFYENGKIKNTNEWQNNKRKDSYYISCNEFGKCKKVFFDSFESKDNPNNWKQNKTENYSTEISNGGFLVKSILDTKKTLKSLINIPLNLEDNFTIETTIDFKSGLTNSGHGLIWGFQNWDNYFSFVISANGQYQIFGTIEGILFPIAEWTKSDEINLNVARNTLKVLKTKDKMFFSINGSLVANSDFYSFGGNNIGFYNGIGGETEVLFEYIEVTQDVNDFRDTSNNLNNNSSWKGNGSGIIVSKLGHIITNYHVIEDSKDIEVEFILNEEVQKFNAEIVQVDKTNDLAVLKIVDINFDGLDELPYNFKTRSSDVGTKVYAYGYPMALSVMGKEIKITDGIISSKSGYDGDITTYQISAPIQGGNSGGPLFDDKGNFLGINSSGLGADVANNVGYTIKSSYVLNLIDVLPKTIDLPSSTKLQSLPLTEQIKEISKYVVLIKVK